MTPSTVPRGECARDEERRFLSTRPAHSFAAFRVGDSGRLLAVPVSLTRFSTPRERQYFSRSVKRLSQLRAGSR
jgi:hypothetical protein